jgi:DNA-binding beta-propeller fold protein YncE
MTIHRALGLGLALALTGLTESACGGGSTLAPQMNGGTTITGPVSTAADVPFSAVGLAVTLPPLANYAETITLPSNNAPNGVALSVTISSSLPSGIPNMPTAFRMSQPFVYFTLSTAKTVTMQGLPGFSLTIPSSIRWNGGPVRVSYYDPSSGWKRVGDATTSGSVVTFAPTDSSVTLRANVKYALVPFPRLVSTLYVANNAPFITQLVTAYDEQGNQLATPGGFPNLQSACGIVFDPHNQHLYVSGGGSSSGQILVYDGQGDQINVTGHFPNSSVPCGMAYDPNNQDLYVTNDTMPGSITVYDEDGDQVTTTGTFPNLSGSKAIAFDSHNGDFYVANSASITVYDAQGNQISTSGSFSGVDFPRGIAFDPNNNLLYVADQDDGTIQVFDEQGNSVSTTGGFPTGGDNPGGITFDPNDDEFYADDTSGTMLVYDAQGDPLATTCNFPNLNGPLQIAVASH